MKFGIHPAVSNEMVDAANFYDKKRPGTGVRFEIAVGRAFKAILAAPERWPVYRRKYRKYVIRTFPYSIFYRVMETEVRVVAVAHSKRRTDYWLKRK